MKRLILVLFVFPVIGYSQVKVNEDSVNYYFEQILNEYRGSVGGVSINKEYKPFTDHWTAYIYNLKKTKDSASYYSEYLIHGKGNESLEKRAERYSSLGMWLFENEIETFNLNKPMSFDNYKFNNLKNIDDRNYLKYVGGKFGGNYTNRDIAWFIFLMWKDSPTHNEVLLNPKATKFYITTYIVGNQITVSYVGLSDIY